jgi:MFS family permease
VEQGLGTSTRLLWYVLMAVAGALACSATGYLYHYLGDRWGRLQAGIAVCSPFLILIGVAMVAPENTTHTALSYQFIAAYQGVVGFGQAGLWLVLASLHAWIMHRIEPSSGPDVSADLSEPLNA